MSRSPYAVLEIRTHRERALRLSEMATTIRRLVEASSRMPVLGSHQMRSYAMVERQLEALDRLLEAEETRITVETITAELYVRRRQDKANGTIPRETEDECGGTARRAADRCTTTSGLSAPSAAPVSLAAMSAFGTY